MLEQKMLIDVNPRFVIKNNLSIDDINRYSKDAKICVKMTHENDGEYVYYEANCPYFSCHEYDNKEKELNFAVTIWTDSTVNMQNFYINSIKFDLDDRVKDNASRFDILISDYYLELMIEERIF